MVLFTSGVGNEVDTQPYAAADGFAARRACTLGLMFETNFSERKNWIAVIFTMVYLLPLSLVFASQVVLKAIAKQAWLELLTLLLLFGLPLAALWVAVVAYPTFRKGARPFQSKTWVQWCVILFLAQGALLCFLFIGYPVLSVLKVVPFAYEPLALGMAMLVGLIGLPATVFSCGVIVKHAKELRRVSGRTDR